MRIKLPPAFLMLLAFVGGCSYYPVPLDPIRYGTSPAEVSTCRGLGAVGLARTDGVGPYSYALRTRVVPPAVASAGSPEFPLVGGEIEGPNFGYRVERMRDAALALGATDLLLSRRIYHDWSYVEGIAYRCPRR